MEKDWILVYSTRLDHLSEMVSQVLKNNGIENVLMNKKDSSYLAFGDLEIYVKEEYVNKSKELILKTINVE